MRRRMVIFGLIAVVSGLSGCSENSSEKKDNDAGDNGSDDLSKDSDSEKDTDSGSDEPNKDSDSEKDTDSGSDEPNKDSDSEKDTDSGSDDPNKDSDSEKDTDSGSDDPNKDSDSEKDTDSGSDESEVTVNESNVCPHVILGNSVPVTYEGNTYGLPDWVESNRLGWEDAPEDTLLFIAPEDGEYVIKVTSDAELDGVWPSIQEYNTDRYYTEADCPAEGTTASLDAVFSSGNPEYPETFTAGQHVLIWVSANTWEPVQSGPYTITIEKLAR